jgi:hypothetical protein
MLRDLGVGKWDPFLSHYLLHQHQSDVKPFYHNIDPSLFRLASAVSVIVPIIHTRAIRYATSRLLRALFAVFFPFHYCTVYPLFFVFLYIAYPLSGVTLTITRTLGVFLLHWSLFMLFCQQGTTSFASLDRRPNFARCGVFLTDETDVKHNKSTE